jgi:Ca2+-transporting ATPase
MTYKWHIPDLNEIEKKLDTDLSEGLSSREARSRLEHEVSRRRGNIPSLFVPKRKTSIQCMTSLILTPAVLLLLIVSLLTAIFGRAALGATVLAVTLVGAAVGGFIELSSARRLDKMAEYASPMIKVKRGGSLYHTDGRNIVRGDVVYLSVGDIMPCDARIIGGSDIVVDEIYWNGKRPCRRSVEKSASVSYVETDATFAPNAKNMLYAGSAVVSGSAVAVVTDVFDDAYLSEHLPCGALASGEREAEGARVLNPFVYKTVFFAIHHRDSYRYYVHFGKLGYQRACF